MGFLAIHEKRLRGIMKMTKKTPFNLKSTQSHKSKKRQEKIQQKKTNK